MFTTQAQWISTISKWSIEESENDQQSMLHVGPGHNICVFEAIARIYRIEWKCFCLFDRNFYSTEIQNNRQCTW